MSSPFKYLTDPDFTARQYHDGRQPHVLLELTFVDCISVFGLLSSQDTLFSSNYTTSISRSLCCIMMPELSPPFIHSRVGESFNALFLDSTLLHRKWYITGDLGVRYRSLIVSRIVLQDSISFTSFEQPVKRNDRESQCDPNSPNHESTFVCFWEACVSFYVSGISLAELSRRSSSYMTLTSLSLPNAANYAHLGAPLSAQTIGFTTYSSK